MTLLKTPGAIKKFGRTPWKFQATFHTPLKQLDLFVAAILDDEGGLEKGTVTIDGVVFDPKNLQRLLAASPLPVELGCDWSISADGMVQIRELLKAALSDWVDFSFIPTPKPFVIYADHDEYTTFYANTKSNLNGVVRALLAKGFKQVLDYQREL
jgi:hypothetical protein